MHGFNIAEEKAVMAIAKQNFKNFKEKWYEYFNK
jgi:hypothetical protein